MRFPPAFILLALVFCAIAGQAAVRGQAPSDFPEETQLFNQSCARCHTIGQGNKAGPDLLGIERRRSREWLTQFVRDPDSHSQIDPLAKELVEEYDGAVMPSFNGPEPMIGGLIDYVASFNQSPMTSPEPGPVDPLPEIVLPPDLDEGRGTSVPGLVVTAGMLLCSGGLLAKNRRSRSSQVLCVLALGVGYWSLGGRAYHAMPGNERGYGPQQPIDFSHKKHVGELKVSCLYCHTQAEKGPSAGIPAVSTCMNCHETIHHDSPAGKGPSPELAKLLDSWASRNTDLPRPIEWVRVHRLPDYARFNHQAHVNNRISCQECHGPVEQMERVRQVSDLSMGWCIRCHRMTKDEAPKHWVRVGATTDCAACHF